MHFSMKFSISLLLLLCCAIYQSYASIDAEAAPVNGSEDGCMCGRIFSPVCGSDSITYSNKCLFECARKKLSLKGRSLTLARSGACATLAEIRSHVAADELAEVDADELADVAADEVDNDLATCICDRSLAPICGSDNRTYNNRCLFDCKRSILARLGRVLSILREGACK
ncbi:PREDICTED: ovomucoid-like [Rhagoletis zephyria]|uniref:ovomucoid-like n=1 Tax=Rhagoletis zephyria TaxID=28612 RepID=UPI0008115C61|nr:PREDICTED: ovomucoid-like [Rhagoletis zephyria]